MESKLPKIYPITDTRISGLSHLEQVELFVAGGAGFIQLREKYATARDFYDQAKKVIEFARKRCIKIIINDRVDIALALGADGVHLGQDDLPPEYARKILGPDAIIGFSTHSLEQARTAMKFPIDYIAIGPIFKTLTKTNPDAVVGLESLRQVRKLIGSLPLVAIGGITEVNLKSVLDAGADSAALIGAILSDSGKIDSQLARLDRIAS